MRSAQMYADAAVPALASIEDEIEQYRREFGEDLPPDMTERLRRLKAATRAEKTEAARLSELDAR
jgi:flavin-dependent dehydrogenase